MNIRLAMAKDMNQLIKMRWDNSIVFDEKESRRYSVLPLRQLIHHLENDHAHTSDARKNRN